MCLKCDLPHLLLSTAAKFLATVTKGIVLFHVNATSTLQRLSTHKIARAEISGLGAEAELLPFSAACGNATYQQEENALVPRPIGVIQKPDLALLLRRTRVNLCQSLD